MTLISIMKRLIAVLPVQLAVRQIKCIMHGLIGPDNFQIRVEIQYELRHGIKNDRFLLLRFAELFKQTQIFLFDLTALWIRNVRPGYFFHIYL